MKDNLMLFLKGAAMGAANVIPGVSGGTIAFITGIYERLISALKSLDTEALRLLLAFKLKDFWRKIDGNFLLVLGLGVIVSILSFAKVLEYCFNELPTFTWAFFFGLILASIILVGKEIKRWNFAVILVLIIGFVIAGGIAFLKPAVENVNFFYLILCGLFGFCSMIIPGLSGAFILVLMGNYLLIITSINRLVSALSHGNFSDTLPIIFKIILPVGIGVILGFVIFSRILNWLFKNYHDIAISLLTGFIVGSLLIIWPWKREIYLLDNSGNAILRKGEKIVEGYDWFLPSLTDKPTLIALALIILGFAIVFAIEKLGKNLSK